MANLSNINNKFIVTDGGDVMINNTIAGYPNGEGLTVKSSDNICRVVLQNSVSGGSVNDGFRIGLVNSNVEFESTESGEFQFYTGGGAAKMTIDSSGKVGIGTDSPYTPLEVSATDPVIRLNVKSGVTDKSNYEIRGIGASGFEGIQFRTVNDANSVYASLMMIEQGGNVGIGTDSPVRNISVFGSSSAVMSFHNSTTGTTISDGMFIGNDANLAYVFNYEATPLIK